MNFIIEPWHWMVLGILLIVFEVFLPSFTALWFGVGAVLVGILLLIFPTLPFEAQVIIWVLLSVAFTVFWFKFLKPLSIDKTQAGLSREAMLGQVGTVIAVPGLQHTGVVRFSMPILGSDEWRCRSQDALSVGDRITVIEILGNEIVVKKL